MSASERHEMVLIGSVESGAEEWACPACGRRMLLRWPPNYERLVVDHGDARVVHIGGKGGVRVSGIEVSQAPATNVRDDDLQWLRDSGIDWGSTSA
jgi:hypothetical protein